jgi:hypothetical protein
MEQESAARFLFAPHSHLRNLLTKSKEKEGELPQLTLRKERCGQWKT